MIMLQPRYWKGVGKTLASPVRLFLTGRLSLEHEGAYLDAASLPGRQGRLALTYLGLSRTRPVPRDELVDALWGSRPPISVDTALSAIVSKLRGALAGVGVPAHVLTAHAGCYELRLPPASTVDVESAANQLDRAEGALRAGDTGGAWSGATVAASILRRPLLPGEDADWLTSHRASLSNLLLRAYDCLADVWLERGNATLATSMAQEALALAPHREGSARRLMRAHAAAGDRGEALRVYEACRVRLRDELGVMPSPQTRALFAELLDG